VAYKVLDICTDALFENGAYGIDTPVLSADDAQMALRWLNRRLDAWAALRRYAYNVSFTEFTLTPNHQPHLIGPGLNAPDFAVAQRPVRIEGAALVLNNVTPNVDLNLNIRDDAWWQAQSVKGIATTTPTDLYYSPDWPNGSLWLWPIPTFAYGLRLEMWGLISRVATLATVFTLPPAYERALVLTLAEDLCRPFGRPLAADLVAAAREARAELQTNNIKSPRIASADYGASGSRGGRRSTFNYYSGQ
jgi:hypothetical protein